MFLWIDGHYPRKKFHPPLKWLRVGGSPDTCRGYQELFLPYFSFWTRCEIRVIYYYSLLEKKSLYRREVILRLYSIPLVM